MTAAGDAERELLRQSVRDFLTSTSPEAQVRRLMATPDGIDAGVWKAMAGQLGLHGLAIPEQYGGSGYGWAELAVVFAELGRTLVTVPYFATVALAATALLESDDEDARQRYLPAMASGDLYATVALPAHAQDTVRAAPDENGMVLHGRRSHVVDGGSAGLLVVPADGPDGPGVYLVDIAADSSGLARTPLPTLDETRKQTDLLFDGCRARPLCTTDAAALVAAVEAAAAIALAGEQVGGAQRCLELAVEYARTRMQFGRPIGSFQAVRHRCVDMLLDVESARSIAGDAALLATRSGLGDASVRARAHAAGAYCSDAFVRVAAADIQVHGGIGATWEHQAHLYLKRAKSSQLLFGTPQQHRAALAELLRSNPSGLQTRTATESEDATATDVEADLADRVERLLAEAPSIDVDRGIPFRGAQFDAGLAWVGFPVGLGGLGLTSRYQPVVERLLHARGIRPTNLLNPIGYGNVAPVLAAHGTDEQRRRFLRSCFTAETVWCQMMSEPDAGSDVAGLSTMARRSAPRAASRTPATSCWPGGSATVLRTPCSPTT